MKVVVRVPWKRPADQAHPENIIAGKDTQNSFRTTQNGWTSQMDQKLWSWLSMSPKQVTNWEHIASKMGVSVEECIKRSEELFKQQLELISQHKQQQQIPNIVSKPSNVQQHPSINERTKESPLQRSQPTNEKKIEYRSCKIE